MDFETDVLVIQGEVGDLLHGGRPDPVVHAVRALIVVVRLGAVRSANVLVLVVHAVLCVAVLWFRVYVAVVTISWRRKGLLRG